MSIACLEQDFLVFLKEINVYQSIIDIIEVHQITDAPLGSVDSYSSIASIISQKHLELETSKKMANFIEKLSIDEVYYQLSYVTQKSLEICIDTFNKNKLIDKDEYAKYVKLCSTSQQKWEEAKRENDFSLIAPYLEKIISYKKSIIEKFKHNYKNPYDVLLDEYEEGLSVEVIDLLFSKLKNEVVNLIKNIKKSGKIISADFLYSHVPAEKQHELAKKILCNMGFDFLRGRLNKSEHPMTGGIFDDVVVTTKYKENDMISGITGVIHEGGHGLYEQNISSLFKDTPLGILNGRCALHESQSLFWEYLTAPNIKFWSNYYSQIQKMYKPSLDKISLEQFHKAIYRLNINPIRLDSDPLSYILHIIIRYEIEKDLFNNKISVSDLPNVWRQKMKEYLGVDIQNDQEGILQDVHWFAGLFGYFPCYIVGYAYAAQFYSIVKKDLPDFDEILSKGNLQEIQQWLKSKIHHYGSSKAPLEILKTVTKEKPNSQYLIDYLYTQYNKIYSLSSN